MILSRVDQDDFFSNYLPLLFYAGIYEGLLPEKTNFKDFVHTDLNLKAECRKALFTDRNVIESYKQDNKRFLGKESKLAFVNNVQKGRYGKFFFLVENSSHSIFQYIENEVFYEVTAITEPISKMVVKYPALITTSIFNFKGKIICDGIIAYGGEMVKGGVTSSLMEKYLAAIQRNLILKKV